MPVISKLLLNPIKERPNLMKPENTSRIIATPSPFARENLLYVQEAGSLTNTAPHISRRKNLNSFLFFIVLGGKGKFCYENKVYPLRQGDCVWIDCRSSYAHESSREFPWELKWVHFYGKGACALYLNYLKQGKPVVFSPSNGGIFNGCLSALYSLHRNNHPQKELLSNKYLTDIITACFEENTDNHPKETHTSDKLEQIRNYLQQHYAEPVNLEMLSSHFYISKYYLAREYKKYFGVTLNNDLTLLRISHGKSLLRFSRLPVEQIALECGYQDANYFIKVFKKMENMTPLEYRKKW